MVKLEFFIDIILPAALWLWVSLKQKWVTGIFPGGKRQPLCWVDNLTTFMCWLPWNLGASNSWNPQGLSRHVIGLFYLYLSTRSSSNPTSHAFRPNQIPEGSLQQGDAQLPRRLHFEHSWQYVLHQAPCQLKLLRRASICRRCCKMRRTFVTGTGTCALHTEQFKKGVSVSRVCEK
jgi:hypothetical protein